MEERDPQIFYRRCSASQQSQAYVQERIFTQLDWRIVYGSEMYRNQTSVCLVKYDHGEILEGIFYAEELQKVIKTDDVYKIEPILKKRKKAEEVSI